MIPRVAHFVWIGRSLSWTHILAVRSAARRGDFSEIRFHHTDDLSNDPWWRELSLVERTEMVRLDPEEVFDTLGARGRALHALFCELEQPAGKSNLLRLALLAHHGGVYLDTDTVTVASFSGLCDNYRFFCGEEPLAFPADISPLGTPARYGAALLRTTARDVMRRFEKGVAFFRAVEHLYPTAANNAVLGAEREHPFVLELLDAALAVPRERRRVRYELGTSLLQRRLAKTQVHELTILPPAVFYPLGPEISQHWFRIRAHANLSDVLLPDTILVHWYASVRTQKSATLLEPAWVRAHAHTQWISALALPFVE